MSFSPEPQDKIKFRRRTNWQVRKEIEEMRDIFYHKEIQIENLPVSGLMDQI